MLLILPGEYEYKVILADLTDVTFDRDIGTIDMDSLLVQDQYVFIQVMAVMLPVVCLRSIDCEQLALCNAFRFLLFTFVIGTHLIITPCERCILNMPFLIKLAHDNFGKMVHWAVLIM